MTFLRPDLLAGTAVALAGGVSVAIRDALVGAGATVDELDSGLDETQAEDWARGRIPLDALVLDSRPAFGPGGAEALRLTLEQAWTATRALANGALIPAERPGRIILVAPSAGDHVGAARSALENLARTLSVEWARYALTVTAVMPGALTTDGELAELVVFLASSAGGYFSGCRLDLGIVPVREPR
jgi:NAD(P)-dependent dehydrogenase (short-subunit alcohol dehydrogenase family)